jgi:hypothetical protein
MLPRAARQIAGDTDVDHAEWPVRDHVNPTTPHAERYDRTPVNKTSIDVPREMAGSGPGHDVAGAMSWL